MSEGLCRFETCRSALGKPYRYVRSNVQEVTFLCAKHRDVVEKTLKNPDPYAQIIITPELWVYVAVPSLEGLPMEKE